MPKPIDVSVPDVQRVQFLIRREGDTHFALVSAEVASQELATERTFLATLTAALSKWASNTKDGALAWTRSSEDFNVGDLASELPGDENGLSGFLLEAGIAKLNVEILHGRDVSRYWSYDTVLIDPDTFKDDA